MPWRMWIKFKRNWVMYSCILLVTNGLLYVLGRWCYYNCGDDEEEEEEGEGGNGELPTPPPKPEWAKADSGEEEGSEFAEEEENSTQENGAKPKME